MANKKLNNQGKKDLKNQENEVPSNNNVQEDNCASEKLDNLKSLNSMLLKETVERRQQVKILEQAKHGLEAELTRSALQNRALEAELKKVTESLEVEKSVMRGFVETQMEEFGAQVEKVREVMEEKEARFEEEIEKLKRECEVLVEEKLEKDRASEAMVRERGLVKKSLDDAVRDIEKLRWELGVVVREKEGVERESAGQRVKIGELEKEVGKLNGIVSELKREENVLRDTVSKLERSFDEAARREKDMVKEIDALSDVKNVYEREMLVLKEENVSLIHRLGLAMNDLNDKVQQEVSRSVAEKNEMEKLKASKEGEIFELQTEVASLRDVISMLQESCKTQTDKNTHLAEQVSKLRNALDWMSRERDNARKGYDGEKKNGAELQSKIVGMEKKIEDTLKELKKVRAEHESLTKINKGNEGRVRKLVTEKDSLEKNLTEAQKTINQLKSRMESSNVCSERALALLKNTAAFINHSKASENGKGDDILGKGKVAKDLQPYAMELEGIKKAFREKESNVENMKQQVELLQNSVADAQKAKSFWTMVSSVTSIFAAISLAFAVTGH